MARLKSCPFTTASTITAPFDFAQGRLEVVPFHDRFKLTHYRNCFAWQRRCMVRVQIRRTASSYSNFRSGEDGLVGAN